MTPEEYFESRPNVAMLERVGNMNHCHLYNEEDGIIRGALVTVDIDWTGYDRTLAYNPHFRWGKRRERVRSSNDYTYTLEENVFQFPKDSHPDSKRGVVMNGEFIGLCPTEDLPTAYQIARLISRAVRVYNAPAHRDSGDADSTESPDSAHWRCPHCECVVNPEDVTYGETHDERYGGCGYFVEPYDAPALADSGEKRMVENRGSE